MTDNWGFVAAAYLLTAVVLGGYWRRLARRERELQRHQLASRGRTGVAEPRVPGAGMSEPHVPRAGHPRSEPASRPPLP